MIAVGQLRRWRGWDAPDGLFLVLEHSPFPLYTGMVDDGWIIMEFKDKPRWEITEHIEESSDLVQDMQMSKEET